MTVFDTPQSTAYARITGLLYLGIAICGIFSIAYVPSQIVVTGDPGATLGNVRDQMGLYQMGLAADALLMLLEIMTLSMLYMMFKPVSSTLSFAAAMARLSMVVVMAVMLFFHAGVLALTEGAPAVMALSTETTIGLAGLLLEMHHAGIWIWQVFFALHLVLLGALVLKSGRFPRLLGYGLMIGASGYLLDSVHAFAFPEVAALGGAKIALLSVVTLSELGFAFWLAVFGPRETREETWARAG